MKQNLYIAKFSDGHQITRQSSSNYPYAWSVSWKHPKTGETIVNDGFCSTLELAHRQVAIHTPTKKKNPEDSPQVAQEKRDFYYVAIRTFQSEVVRSKRVVPKSRQQHRIPKMVRL